MTTYPQETEEERIEREQNPQQGDSFDALWDRLKQSVRERREPEAVYTMGGTFDRNHARFDSGDAEDDEDGTPIVSLHMGAHRSHVMGYANREDLINIAEHCLLRAAQIESK
jgi:hypothetical protein